LFPGTGWSASLRPGVLTMGYAQSRQPVGAPIQGKKVQTIATDNRPGDRRHKI
jgi:hypothetical protein